MSFVQQARGNELTGPERIEGSKSFVSNQQGGIDRIDKKSVWGLYCMYVLVGLVAGFWQNYLILPIGLYVFHGNQAQRTVAINGISVPWSVKVFVALFLETAGRKCVSCWPAFGRRRGFIITGWTLAMGMIVVLAFLSESLVKQQPTHPGGKSPGYGVYSLMLMAVTACYIISDVAGDGMTIELSKLEPDATRGHILATGQLCRFVTLMATNIFGLVFMNGKDYNAEGSTSAFPINVSFMGIHLMLVCMCAPFYIMMVMWLKDPPDPASLQLEEHAEGGEAHGKGHGLAALWKAIRNYAVFMLIVQNLGNIAFAGFVSPAFQAIANIVTPTTLQQSIGNIFSWGLFSCGVWIFRKFFMNSNWRFTLVWTNCLAILNAAINFAIIYDWGGVCQNPWFYTFGTQILSITVGIAQVLSSLAVVEISPPGLEATVYELLTTVHNGAITLTGVMTEKMITPLHIDEITNKTTYLANQEYFNSQMGIATWITMAFILFGTFGFMWFMPKNKDECRRWRDTTGCWESTGMGLLNIAMAIVPCGYSITSTIMTLISPE